MGGTFEDFLRFMFELTISVRKSKSGEIEFVIKPRDKRKFIRQRANNLASSIKRIKDNYSVNLAKYKNGDLSPKEFGFIYKACKKNLSIKQRELNKLDKFSKSSKTSL